jgi:hypothetical protein
MRLVVVIDEFGDGIVVAAGYHAGGGGFRFNCRKGTLAVFFSGSGRATKSITLTLLLIEWFLLGIRAIRTLISSKSAFHPSTTRPMK